MSEQDVILAYIPEQFLDKCRFAVMNEKDLSLRLTKSAAEKIKKSISFQSCNTSPVLSIIPYSDIMAETFEPVSLITIF